MAEIILKKEKPVDIFIETSAFPGVRRTAGKVMNDIKKVIGCQCSIGNKYDQKNMLIIVGTRGNSKIISGLESSVPKLSELDGKRESYLFEIIRRPFPDVESAILICGSDLLGTIYGLFYLSELLQVSPLCFWGDVMPKHYDCVILKGTAPHHRTEYKQESLTQYGVDKLTKEPSVRYRGFFINDEWPCFGNWTFSHFNGFTAKMYDKVFELLLRLKGNYLWPAMWTSSFLLDGPDMKSMELADEYGIFIGMSHHEPCMRSSEEWKIISGAHTPYKTAWSYLDNKEGLLNYWRDSLQRSRGHNVLPTLGMRGEYDSTLMAGADLQLNISTLEEIISSQRQLMKEHLTADIKGQPKLFAVYKEVEDYYFGDKYTKGLCEFKELDDTILLLCEDNYGNMRALPNKKMSEHQGGFGIYYHFDYHGSPCSYEWVNSSTLSKVWEQMTMAYDYGIRDLWIVNVGDLKFQEYPLSYFMEMAYDFEKWGTAHPESPSNYCRLFVEQQFGNCASAEQKAEIAYVLGETGNINALRRPESLNDTVYHPVHNYESKRMLRRCEKLIIANDKSMAEMAGQGCGEAYYSMIYYAAAASANLLQMHLNTGLNHYYAAQGKAIANLYGEKVEQCINRDKELAEEFAGFKDGKWGGMELAHHIGFTNWNDEDWRYPVQHLLRLPEEPRLVVSKADEQEAYTNQYFPITLEIKDFRNPGVEEIELEIANGGQGVLNWWIDEVPACLSMSTTSGKAQIQAVVKIRALWKKIPYDQDIRCTFKICTKTEFVPVCVWIHKHDFKQIPDKTFVGSNNVVVIDAIHYTVAVAGAFQGTKVSFLKLNDYGKRGSGMKMFPTTASFGGKDNAPSLTYQVWLDNEGDYTLELHTSPSNPVDFNGSHNVGIAVNGGQFKTHSLIDSNYHGGDPDCQEWAWGVLNQEHINKVEICFEKGLNEITIFGQDAGIVLQYFLIYPAGTMIKKSYLGPRESFFKNERSSNDAGRNENSGNDRYQEG